MQVEARRGVGVPAASVTFLNYQVWSWDQEQQTFPAPELPLKPGNSYFQGIFSFYFWLYLYED